MAQLVDFAVNAPLLAGAAYTVAVAFFAGPHYAKKTREHLAGAQYAAGKVEEEVSKLVGSTTEPNTFITTVKEHVQHASQDTIKEPSQSISGKVSNTISKVLDRSRDTVFNISSSTSKTGSNAHIVTTTVNPVDSTSTPTNSFGKYVLGSKDYAYNFVNKLLAHFLAYFLATYNWICNLTAQLHAGLTDLYISIRSFVSAAYTKFALNFDSLGYQNVDNYPYFTRGLTVALLVFCIFALLLSPVRMSGDPVTKRRAVLLSCGTSFIFALLFPFFAEYTQDILIGFAALFLLTILHFVVRQGGFRAALTRFIVFSVTALLGYTKATLVGACITITKRWLIGILAAYYILSNSIGYAFSYLDVKFLQPQFAHAGTSITSAFQLVNSYCLIYSYSVLRAIPLAVFFTEMYDTLMINLKEKHEPHRGGSVKTTLALSVLALLQMGQWWGAYWTDGVILVLLSVPVGLLHLYQSNLRNLPDRIGTGIQATSIRICNAAATACHYIFQGISRAAFLAWQRFLFPSLNLLWEGIAAVWEFTFNILSALWCNPLTALGISFLCFIVHGTWQAYLLSQNKPLDRLSTWFGELFLAAWSKITTLFGSMEAAPEKNEALKSVTGEQTGWTSSYFAQIRKFTSKGMLENTGNGTVDLAHLRNLAHNMTASIADTPSTYFIKLGNLTSDAAASIAKLPSSIVENIPISDSRFYRDAWYPLLTRGITIALLVSAPTLVFIAFLHSPQGQRLPILVISLPLTITLSYGFTFLPWINYGANDVYDIILGSTVIALLMYVQRFAAFWNQNPFDFALVYVTFVLTDVCRHLLWIPGMPWAWNNLGQPAFMLLQQHVLVPLWNYTIHPAGRWYARQVVNPFPEAREKIYVAFLNAYDTPKFNITRLKQMLRNVKAWVRTQLPDAPLGVIGHGGIFFILCIARQVHGLWDCMIFVWRWIVWLLCGYISGQQPPSPEHPEQPNFDPGSGDNTITSTKTNASELTADFPPLPEEDDFLDSPSETPSVTTPMHQPTLLQPSSTIPATTFGKVLEPQSQNSSSASNMSAAKILPAPTVEDEIEIEDASPLNSSRTLSEAETGDAQMTLSNLSSVTTKAAAPTSTLSNLGGLRDFKSAPNSRPSTPGSTRFLFGKPPKTASGLFNMRSPQPQQPVVAGATFSRGDSPTMPKFPLQETSGQKFGGSAPPYINWINSRTSFEVGFAIPPSSPRATLLQTLGDMKGTKEVDTEMGNAEHQLSSSDIAASKPESNIQPKGDIDMGGMNDGSQAKSSTKGKKPAPLDLSKDKRTAHTSQGVLAVRDTDDSNSKAADSTPSTRKILKARLGKKKAAAKKKGDWNSQSSSGPQIPAFATNDDGKTPSKTEDTSEPTPGDLPSTNATNANVPATPCFPSGQSSARTIPAPAIPQAGYDSPSYVSSAKDAHIKAGVKGPTTSPKTLFSPSAFIELSKSGTVSPAQASPPRDGFSVDDKGW